MLTIKELKTKSLDSRLLLASQVVYSILEPMQLRHRVEVKTVKEVSITFNMAEYPATQKTRLFELVKVALPSENFICYFDEPVDELTIVIEE